MNAEYLCNMKEDVYKKEVGINTNTKVATTHNELTLDLDKRHAKAFSKKTAEYNVPLDLWIS